MTLAATVTYSFAQAQSDLAQILPVVVLTVALLVAIVADLVVAPSLRGPVVAGLAVLGFLATLAAAAYLWVAGGHAAYHGFATGDRFAAFFEALFAVLGVFTVAVSQPYLRRRRFLQAEFHILILAAVVGMMVLASATSLVSVFLGLELLSISLYIAAGFARSDRASQEAGAKYLLVGGFASAFVLYGMALVYGASGTTVLSGVARAVAQDTNNPLLFLGVVLMGVGFAFKVSAAPFHMWTPDVYQGSPLPVTAFMSVGTKAAAFAMIVRVFMSGLPSLSGEWQALLAFVAVASMLVGNLMAIVQDSVKRLLAYSGVAHAGYILVGVLAGGRAGVGAVLFYLVAYLFMNFGAFAVLFALTREEGEYDSLENLDGLGRRHPWRFGVPMTVFMLSLAGFPPSVGFFGKFFLFAAAVQAGFTWLVVIAVLMSVVSVYYYVRVLLHVWALPVSPRSWLPAPASVGAAVGLAGFGSVALGAFPAVLLALGLRGAGPFSGSP